jgi:3-oxoacyl-[acyl-carrier-protein] synthase-3
MRRVKILGTGTYLPKQRISPEDLANKMGVDVNAIQKVGMKSRYYASKSETASYMAARAAKVAIQDAGLTLSDIDIIICASGTMQMPIPCTAALIHNALNFDEPIPAFDVNATCLSFLTALDTSSYLIEANKYRNILIVSSEIASIGLNYNDLESAVLFGDGAAAVVVSKSSSKDSSKIMASQMNTFSDSWKHCKIAGGGTECHAENWSPDKKEMFQFQMNGKEVFKVALKVLPEFIEKLFQMAKTQMEEIDVVIPHQASLSAMNLLQKKLQIKDEQMTNIIEDYGNMIAASIPFALNQAIKTDKLKRGNRILLLGTSAGVSVGGMILEY